jgi:hypothetical protein
MNEHSQFDSWQSAVAASASPEYVAESADNEYVAMAIESGSFSRIGCDSGLLPRVLEVNLASFNVETVNNQCGMLSGQCRRKWLPNLPEDPRAAVACTRANQ